MAGALRKTMVYLGLAEDDDRYDDDEHRDDAAGYDDDRRRTPERSERSERPLADRPETGAAVTQLPRRPAPVARLVREPEVGPLNRITTIHPRTYNEAKTIGEAFRDGTPVIMNLSDMGDADAKRLVDFAAGLAFALRGSFDKVATKVFLLSPADVAVTADERKRIAEAGFYAYK
jgi:cell division inhibitor SepF